MISEKTKLKIISKDTKDLLELQDIINEELNTRQDNEINMAELEYGFNFHKKVSK